jgi:hypothetical protein
MSRTHHNAKRSHHYLVGEADDLLLHAHGALSHGTPLEHQERFSFGSQRLGAGRLAWKT